MRSLKLAGLFLLFACSLSAQLRLNVSGDAKIRGQLNLSSPGNNLFLGADTGEAITTGQFNTFIGQAAGVFNKQGESNTFLGVLSGYSNTSGDKNTFIGVSAGLSNLSGNDNIFLGFEAGRNNTTGQGNIFVGNSAGYFNNSGKDNTFLGMEAGKNNQSSRNTFVGSRAGAEISNPLGDCNTYIGFETGQYNEGNHNIIVGTCFSIDVGALNSDNTIMGWGAGALTTSGNANVIMGSQAGGNNKAGGENVFVGRTAGFNNTTGSNNTFVGRNAGFNNITGDNLVAIGASASASLIAGGSIDNAFTLGNNSQITASHSGVLGNISLQKITGYVNLGTASDGRMKKQVQEDVHGLDFILQLRPVSYQVDALKLDQFLRQGMEDLPAGKEDQSAEEKAQAQERRQTYEGYLREKSAIRYTGFIAQEVEKAMNNSGFEFSGLVKPAHDQDHYSLRYAEFVMPLVKGMQEQQGLIEKQEKEHQIQQHQIEQLQTEVTELKALVRQLLANQENQTPVQQYELQPKQQARLSQNYPNPFQEDTLIDYFIPETVQNARLEIHAVDGKHLASIPIQNTGAGQVMIKAASYPAGTYLYSLVLDGEVATSLQMVLTR